jgi:hypothetical protein
MEEFMPIDSRILIIGALFILKFIFGFMLYRSGKPYHGVILAIHKLTSMAALVYIAVISMRIHQDTGFNTGEVISVITTCALFAIAVGSGGILSMDKPSSVMISIAHKVTPFLTTISTTVTVYLIILIK